MVKKKKSGALYVIKLSFERLNVIFFLRYLIRMLEILKVETFRDNRQHPILKQ